MSTPSASLRVAYADPPYLGKSSFGAEHHYGPDAAVYDALEGHRALIERLVTEFPDGWVLSLHAPSLRDLLPLCSADVRVGAWVKPWCSWKPGVSPVYAWEPVIWRGGRKLPDSEKTRDFVSASATTDTGVRGAKPTAFCRWVFRLLGLCPSDELVDLFPGSGGVGLAWERFCDQAVLV